MFLVQFQPKKSNLCCLGVQLVECTNQLGELDAFCLVFGESIHGLGESAGQTATKLDFFSFYCRYNKKTSLGSNTTVGF